MSVKEMTDNAVDAIKAKKSSRTTGIISIVLTENDCDHFEDKAETTIKIKDNGLGIDLDSIEKLGSYFGTTKLCQENTDYAGKFGIGLKLVLNSSTDKRLEVLFRTSPETCCQATLCSAFQDEICVENHVLKHFSEEKWPWMTQFRAVLPTQETAYKDIRDYVSLIGIFNPGLAIYLSISDADCAGDPDLNIEKSSCETFRTDLLIQYLTLKSENIVSTIVKQSGGQTTTCIIGLDEEVDEDQDNTYIEVLRFVNGMPLPSGDGLSCSITKSLCDFFFEFGEEFGCRGFVSIEDDQPEDPEAWIISGHTNSYSKFKRLSLCFNIKMNDVGFATVSKSFLKDEKIRAGILDSTLCSMKKLKEQFPHLLSSQHENENIQKKKLETEQKKH
eukprot:GHVP01069302.1.p2 GENE.GHVP01069302.1~~GHVP01069302.1.p2  ORF type:complete len:388 (-),score=78.93 GHVP01069302.1:1387-2550(-)